MVMPDAPVTAQLVNFVSTSENASAFEWDLGKSEPKVFGATVSTTYATTGNYTITLKAMGAGGQSSTSQTITVGTASVAGLKAMFELFDPTGLLFALAWIVLPSLIPLLLVMWVDNFLPLNGKFLMPAVSVSIRQ